MKEYDNKDEFALTYLEIYDSSQMQKLTIVTHLWRTGERNENLYTQLYTRPPTFHTRLSLASHFPSSHIKEDAEKKIAVYDKELNLP